MKNDLYRSMVALVSGLIVAFSVYYIEPSGFASALCGSVVLLAIYKGFGTDIDKEFKDYNYKKSDYLLNKKNQPRPW